MDTLVKKLIAGNRRALGQAITLVESKSPARRAQADKTLQDSLPYAGKSVRIGISGTPGVGKSTFIETLGMKLIAAGKKLAVLAVDPSSPLSAGSILGDKTRMQQLASQQEAFIRPSPAGTTLGGVARNTREAILLCEAAGYDFIIVETVGVGQSEYTVRSMVDVFVYLQLPNAGDELQGIKKGILEVADLILINKADGKNKLAAQRAKVDLELALNLIYKQKPQSKPHVLLVSALENIGIDALTKRLDDLVHERKVSGQFSSNRNQQTVQWYQEEVSRLILETIQDDRNTSQCFEQYKTQVASNTATPREAARNFVKSLYIQGGSHDKTRS